MKNVVAGFALALTFGIAPLFAQTGKESAKESGELAKGVEVAIKDLEDYSAKNDQFLLNNISLKETADEENKSIGHVRVSSNVRNRTDKNLKYRLMIVGFDASKKPLWTYNSHNQELGAKDQATLEDTLALPVGTAKATTTLWARIVHFP